MPSAYSSEKNHTKLCRPIVSIPEKKVNTKPKTGNPKVSVSLFKKILVNLKIPEYMYIHFYAPYFLYPGLPMRSEHLILLIWTTQISSLPVSPNST